MRRPSVLSQSQPAGLILFNSTDECYFALDEIGSLVWEKCDGAHAISEIIAELCEQYEAPSAVIEDDLSELMSEFNSRGLLSPADLFRTVAEPEPSVPATTAIRFETIPVKGPLVERVGTYKGSGSIFFRAKYLEDGREVEKVFYDEDGNVTKRIEYQHDEEPGYKMMEVFNGRGRILLRHERGKPPEQFDL